MSSQGSYKREVEGECYRKGSRTCDDRSQRREGCEEADMSHGIQAPLEAGKDEEMDSPLEPQKETVCSHLDCSPLSPVSDFCPPER